MLSKRKQSSGHNGQQAKVHDPENSSIFNPYAIHGDNDIEKMRCRTTRCKGESTYSGEQQSEEMITSVRYAKGEDGTDRARVYAFINKRNYEY